MHDVPGATHVRNVSTPLIYMLSMKFLRYAKDAILSLCATHVERKRQRMNLIIMFSEMLKTMGDVEFAYAAVTRECHRKMLRNTPAMSAVIVDT